MDTQTNRTTLNINTMTDRDCLLAYQAVFPNGAGLFSGYVKRPYTYYCINHGYPNSCTFELQIVVKYLKFIKHLQEHSAIELQALSKRKITLMQLTNELKRIIQHLPFPSTNSETQIEHLILTSEPDKGEFNDLEAHSYFCNLCAQEEPEIKYQIYHPEWKVRCKFTSMGLHALVEHHAFLGISARIADFLKITPFSNTLLNESTMMIKQMPYTPVNREVGVLSAATPLQLYDRFLINSFESCTLIHAFKTWVKALKKTEFQIMDKYRGIQSIDETIQKVNCILSKAFLIHEEALKTNPHYYNQLVQLNRFPLDCAHIAHKIDDIFSVFIGPTNSSNAGFRTIKAGCDLCDYNDFCRDYYIFNRSIEDIETPWIVISSSNWHNFSIHHHTYYDMAGAGFMQLYNPRFHSVHNTFEWVLFGRSKKM